MYELLYTSTTTNNFSDLELLGLLREARIKNDALKISGLMLYHEGDVLQILEGDTQVVRSLFYDTIAKDKRHKQVEVFYEGGIDHRAFEGWAMAFRTLNEKNLSNHFPGYETLARIPKLMAQHQEIRNPGKKAFFSFFNSMTKLRNTYYHAA